MSADPEDYEAARNAATVTLLTHLFHESYCPAEGVTGQDKALAPAADFVAWLSTRVDDYDADAVCARAGVPPSAWDDLRAHLADPGFVSDASAAWWVVRLADRMPPPSPVTRITLTTLVHFADGRVGVLAAGMDADPDHPVGDGLFLAQAQAAFRGSVVAPVAGAGLADVHATAMPCNGQTGFELFMGSLLRGMAQLGPEAHSCVVLWKQLAQVLMRPGPLPAPPVKPPQVQRGGLSW